MRVVFSETASKQFKKLDKHIQIQIKDYIDKLSHLSEPKSLGKSLKGSFSNLWRYRIGDYRIICEIQYEQILILVVRIGHRKDIYRS